LIESVEMIIRQPGHPDRVVRLQEGATRLGRSEDCEVVLSDVGVSRRHARLLVARDEVQVEDLGSGNGTYHQGRRVDRHKLRDGDELIIDPFVLQFRIRGDAKDQNDDPTLDGPLARLDVVHGPGLTQSSYSIPATGLTLGRSETRDVVIPDPASSRHHCSIFFQDGQYILRDMGSANGVFVNAYRVKESILTDGDQLQIGNTELRFILDDATKADGGTPQGRSAPPTRGSRGRSGPGPARGWDELDRWSENEISLPVPEARRRGTGVLGRWVSMALGGATLLTFMALVMVISGALLYVVVKRTRAPATTTAVSGPPTWTLDVTEAPGSVDVGVLFDAGLESMRQRDHKAALRAFYQALSAEPNNASAERFAFVAGEYVLLGTLQPALDASERALRAERYRRDELLKEVSRGGRRGRAAADALATEFRNDAVVLETMGWGLSSQTRRLQERVADAAEAVTREAWAEAVTVYEEVLAEAPDAALRKTARGGLRVGRRELARGASEYWRLGILAEAEGNIDKARGYYEHVLGTYPGNPSASLRLERLTDE
jgi:pSer/pThr/pTyr-binding forkhead associated (FHA) protein/tetratricopeptide (TPR) repeat protein